MNVLRKYGDMFREARRSVDYWVELSIIEFTQSLKRLIRPMTQAEFAKKSGLSEGYVSRVLNGRDNLTIRQMNKFASHLDAAVHIHVSKRNTWVSWSEQDFDRPLTATSIVDAERVYEAWRISNPLPTVLSGEPADTVRVVN